MVPGFWLDASSWDEVVPSLRESGHTVVALTLPGLESTSSDRRTIGLRHHVAAVIDAIDSAAGPVVLVGHSGGGPIAYAAADARPERVSRLVFVDTWPNGPGRCINDELPVVDGEIPLPDWSVFEEEDLVDMTDALRAMLRERAIPQPAAVASDPQVLGDPRRLDIPATVIACEFSAEQLRGWMANGAAALQELASMSRVDYVDLPTGHWPQFTKPRELAAAIVRAIA